MSGGHAPGLGMGKARGVNFSVKSAVPREGVRGRLHLNPAASKD
jgi:hypothetical protein